MNDPARLRPLALALALLLSPVPSSAQEAIGAGRDADYAQCMDLARSDPEAGLALAESWAAKAPEDRALAAAAGHCAAVALLGLERYGEAGERLEALAQPLAAERPPLAAQLFAQAGQAWMLAGGNERAEAVLDRAIALTPADTDLYIDRSFARVGLGKYREAVDDLSRAAELAPDLPEIYLYRATAHRYLESYDLARADLERSLKLAPDRPEALLERGNLRRLTGDPDGARDDWLKVLELAPEGPSAEAARANIERLDVKVEPEVPLSSPDGN